MAHAMSNYRHADLCDGVLASVYIAVVYTLEEKPL